MNSLSRSHRRTNIVALLSAIFCAAMAPQAQAQVAETLSHYRVNADDDLATAVPNLGTLGFGIPSGGGTRLSTDLPTVGVPPNLGDRSIDLPGTAGIVAPGTQQLLNEEIRAHGGFTFEA